MSGRHRLDPTAQHRAAALAGMLAARGLVDGPKLLDAIGRMARAAAPGCDRSGLAMRLAHGFADAHAATVLARDVAGRRLAAALWPLLERRAPAAALLAAAEAADPEGVLSDSERRAQVEAAIRRILRGQRLGGGAR